MTFIQRAMLCVLAAGLTCCPASLAEEYIGRVVGVSDGDTITVLHAGRPEKVRLAEVDCPEKRQAFGWKAREFTARQSFGKEVTVRSEGTDRWGRSIAQVVLPGGESLNCMLIQEGFAWWYARYSRDTGKQRLEELARAERRGLWAEPAPVAPWDYRHHPEARVRLTRAPVRPQTTVPPARS